MNFSDMASLKAEDISEGRIKYVRQKTKQVYDVKIVESLKPILEFYSVEKLPGELYLPDYKTRNTSR